MVDVTQERDDRRPFDQIRRIFILLFEIGEHLIFQADRLLEFDVDAQLGCDELGHVWIHLAVMVVITPSFIRIRKISLAGTPAASESSRTVQGS